MDILGMTLRYCHKWIMSESYYNVIRIVRVIILQDQPLFSRTLDNSTDGASHCKQESLYTLIN